VIVVTVSVISVCDDWWVAEPRGGFGLETDRVTAREFVLVSTCMLVSAVIPERFG
jgi:hypothetical protein